MDRPHLISYRTLARSLPHIFFRRILPNFETSAWVCVSTNLARAITALIFQPIWNSLVSHYCWAFKKVVRRIASAFVAITVLRSAILCGGLRRSRDNCCIIASKHPPKNALLLVKNGLQSQFSIDPIERHLGLRP